MSEAASWGIPGPLASWLSVEARAGRKWQRQEEEDPTLHQDKSLLDWSLSSFDQDAQRPLSLLFRLNPFPSYFPRIPEAPLTVQSVTAEAS